MPPFHNKNTEFFPFTQFKSDPNPELWSDLQSGSKPISTKFAVAGSSPIQVRSNAHLWHTVS